MRPRVAWFLAAAGLALLLFLPPAAASTTIPGTSLQVVDLGTAAPRVPLGSAANFSWAIYNAGVRDATLNVSARASDPSFLVSVGPSSLLVPRDGLEQIYVNVSTPGSSSLRSVTIDVTFEALSPDTGNLTRSVVVNVDQPPIPLDVLTAFLAVGAMVASFMVSYTRARGEGLGVTMKETGLDTRVERIVIMVAGLLTGFIVPALAIILAFSLVSFLQRMRHIWKATR